MDITKGLASDISLFKDWKDTLAKGLSSNRYQPERIFRVIYDDDLGERSVTVESLNEYFRNVREENYDAQTRQIVYPTLRNMILTMQFLQEMYESDNYDNPHRPYKYACREYPERYKALVLGVDENALSTIASFDMAAHTKYLDEVGLQEFVKKIRLHRALFEKQNSPEIPYNAEAEERYGHLTNA